MYHIANARQNEIFDKSATSGYAILEQLGSFSSETSMKIKTILSNETEYGGMLWRNAHWDGGSFHS